MRGVKSVKGRQRVKCGRGKGGEGSEEGEEGEEGEKGEESEGGGEGLGIHWRMDLGFRVYGLERGQRREWI